MLQEAGHEEPKDLRSIGIDPVAFISEVRMERTLKHLPHLYGDSGECFKQSSMHMLENIIKCLNVVAFFVCA